MNMTASEATVPRWGPVFQHELAASFYNKELLCTLVTQAFWTGLWADLLFKWLSISI
jgi:hypothetical protein